jgi:hypothetical protein
MRDAINGIGIVGHNVLEDLTKRARVNARELSRDPERPSTRSCAARTYLAVLWLKRWRPP